MRSPLIEDVALEPRRRDAASLHASALAPRLGRGRSPSTPPITASLDADAERALHAFRRQVWILSRNAPAHIVSFGQTASDLYLRALCAAATASSARPWSDFVRAVWLLISELDAYPSQASSRWREARGALSRIVIDNVDLLEGATPGRRHETAAAIGR